MGKLVQNQLPKDKFLAVNGAASIRKLIFLGTS